MAILATYIAECDICKQQVPADVTHVSRGVGRPDHPSDWKVICVNDGADAGATVVVCGRECAQTHLLKECDRLYPPEVSADPFPMSPKGLYR